jgi:hypothetical protein
MKIPRLGTFCNQSVIEGLIWTLDMMLLYEGRINNANFAVYMFSVLIGLLQE